MSSALKVIRTERVKKCTKCDCIVEAPAPSRPIERGIASPGLFARVFTGKSCEHLLLCRQSEIFARQGVELSRALLSNWVDACCQLITPLNDALYRYVMNTRKLHTDDTPVKVLAPGLKKTKTGRIWTYVRDDRNAGSSSPPAVWFAYSPNRQGKHQEQHLHPFRGILQADAFAGSDSGGEHAAVLYSLIGTCRLNNVEPEKWLRYVIEHIQDWPANRIRDLLPWKVDLSAQ